MLPEYLRTINSAGHHMVQSSGSIDPRLSQHNKQITEQPMPSCSRTSLPRFSLFHALINTGTNVTIPPSLSYMPVNAVIPSFFRSDAEGDDLIYRTLPLFQREPRLFERLTPYTSGP